MNKRGSPRNHIKFSYRKVKWTTGGRYIPERGEYRKYSEIKQTVDKIREESEKKEEIIKDKNLYFVIRFTEEINSLNITRLINSFDLLKIAKIIDEFTAKFSLNKEFYPNFLAFIERKNKYFSDIKGVTLSDIFSKDLLNEMKNVELNNLNVVMEFSSALSHQSKKIQQNLNEYLTRTNSGKVKSFEKIGYNILCRLNIKKDYIKELASQIDGINNIQKEQRPLLNSFNLQGIEERTTKHHKAKLTQMPSSIEEDIPPNKLPIIAILDSGISNPNNKINSNLIDSTYDFETEQATPCKDECGHGTFVSGRAIHGGNISTNPALCKVAVAKLFKKHDTLVKTDLSLLGMIQTSIQIFNKKTRVYNLSFCMDGPDPILSKRLDYIANKNNILFINSSGNFDINEIKHYLNNGIVYPEYLTELNVYPPADCFNILTVGSYTHKSSNLCPVNAPSPFTRCIALNDRIKPEVLCEGGNLLVEYGSGQITNLKTDGLTVWSYSHEEGSGYADGVGTSYSAPIASSIAARLFFKYNKSSINLIKALIINSCTLLQDQTGEIFDSRFQGFGVPNDYFTMNSSKSRVTLYSEADFDLKDKNRFAHEYKFHVPDDVWRIIITIVFTNPIEEHLPPGKLAVSLKYAIHKAGVRLNSKSKPTKDMTKSNENIIHIIYDPKRGGRGVWKLKLKPRLFFPLNEHYLKYAVVITQIAKGSTNIYDKIEEALKN